MSSLVREDMGKKLFGPLGQRLVDFIQIEGAARDSHYLCASGTVRPGPGQRVGEQAAGPPPGASPGPGPRSLRARPQPRPAEPGSRRRPCGTETPGQVRRALRFPSAPCLRAPDLPTAHGRQGQPPVKGPPRVYPSHRDP